MTGHGRIIDSRFRPARWLRNPHAQTLWAALAPRGRQPDSRKERWELADGDFLDLVWSAGHDGPLVVLLHGLEGSIDSGYIAGLRRACAQRGWQSCLLHFRNCGGQPNRLARSYHSGETGDLQQLLTRIRQEDPGRPLAVVGFSLGGNVLLKWLGEQREHAGLDAAVAVSVPMRLDLCADRMQRGFSRFYQRFLVGRLHASCQLKFQQRDDFPYPLEQLGKLDSFWLFDHHITAPLHGFDSVHDYYQRASSRQFLPHIRKPTLIIHALDDPFMTADVVPSAQELSATTTLDLSRYGGHVGFVAGDTPWRPRYWLDQRIPDFLADYLKA